MAILPIGAVLMIVAVLLSAWLMTFARWLPIAGIDAVLLGDALVLRTAVKRIISGYTHSLFCFQVKK